MGSLATTLPILAFNVAYALCRFAGARPCCRCTNLNPTQVFLFFDNRQEFPKINMMATYI